MDQEARLLFAMEPLRAPVIDAAIQALHLPPGSRGLDVGCGVGLQATRLAEAVGPSGHVTGLDMSPRLLEHARRCEQSGLAEGPRLVSGRRHEPAAVCRQHLRLVVERGLCRIRASLGTSGVAERTHASSSGLAAWWRSCSGRVKCCCRCYPVLEARLNATRGGHSAFRCGDSARSPLPADPGLAAQSGSGQHLGRHLHSHRVCPHREQHPRGARRPAQDALG